MKTDVAHGFTKKHGQKGCAPCAPITNKNWNRNSLAFENSPGAPRARCPKRYCPRIWLNSLGQYVRIPEKPVSVRFALAARPLRSKRPPTVQRRLTRYSESE